MTSLEERIVAGIIAGWETYADGTTIPSVRVADGYFEEDGDDVDSILVYESSESGILQNTSVDSALYLCEVEVCGTTAAKVRNFISIIIKVMAANKIARRFGGKKKNSKQGVSHKKSLFYQRVMDTRTS